MLKISVIDSTCDVKMFLIQSMKLKQRQTNSDIEVFADNSRLSFFF